MIFKQAAVKTSQIVLGVVLSFASIALVGLMAKVIWRMFMFGFNLL
jgi:hypothetical protein